MSYISWVIGLSILMFFILISIFIIYQKNRNDKKFIIRISISITIYIALTIITLVFSEVQHEITVIENYNDISISSISIQVESGNEYNEITFIRHDIHTQFLFVEDDYCYYTLYIPENLENDVGD